MSHPVTVELPVDTLDHNRDEETSIETEKGSCSYGGRLLERWRRFLHIDKHWCFPHPHTHTGTHQTGRKVSWYWMAQYMALSDGADMSRPAARMWLFYSSNSVCVTLELFGSLRLPPLPCLKRLYRFHSFLSVCLHVCMSECLSVCVCIRGESGPIVF